MLKSAHKMTHHHALRLYHASMFMVFASIFVMILISAFWYWGRQRSLYGWETGRLTFAGQPITAGETRILETDIK